MVSQEAFATWGKNVQGKVTGSKQGIKADGHNSYMN